MSFGVRSHNVEKLYYFSRDIYRNVFKKNLAWEISKIDLLNFPKFSLGFDLGIFLDQNNFELEKKLENHDIFHVLTGINTAVFKEVGLQYYLLGNGKTSLYLFGVILTGSLFYPEKWLYFWQNWQFGKKARKFHDLDFWSILDKQTTVLRQNFGMKY